MIDKIEDFLMDLDSVLYDHDIKADIIVNFNVSESRIKPAGNMAYRRKVENKKCPMCDNTMMSDGKINWCTYIHCQHIEAAK